MSNIIYNLPNRSYASAVLAAAILHLSNGEPEKAKTLIFSLSKVSDSSFIFNCGPLNQCIMYYQLQNYFE